MLILCGCEHTETIDKGKTRNLKDTMTMSSNEDTRNNSYLGKFGVCYLRLEKDLNFTNTGYKWEFPYNEIENFVNKNSEEMGMILETYVDIKKKLKKENLFIGKYDKKEDSIICSLILFAHKKYGINYNVSFDFVSSILSKDSCKDKELNKFRLKVLKDSEKIKHHRWSFVQFKDFFLKELKNYNKRIM
jgi:hypothetical protein